jgi:hypothetical protein
MAADESGTLALPASVPSWMVIAFRLSGFQNEPEHTYDE